MMSNGPFAEDDMTEIEKLTTLREKLVARRRMLAESLADVDPEQLSGKSISLVQDGIEAVDRAIEDEMHTESGRGAATARQKMLQR
jgi:hypothetical protein